MLKKTCAIGGLLFTAAAGALAISPPASAMSYDGFGGCCGHFFHRFGAFHRHSNFNANENDVFNHIRLRIRNRNNNIAIARNDQAQAQREHQRQDEFQRLRNDDRDRERDGLARVIPGAPL